MRTVGAGQRVIWTVNTAGTAATLEDVAKSADTSVATAGRALGGYGKVAKATRERVIAAARKLNYHANALARGMKSRSSLTIGVIVGNICNPFFSTIIRAIETTASRHGYNVIVCDTDENVEKEWAHAKTLLERRVDGIIVSTTASEDGKRCKAVRDIYGQRIPTVLIDRSVDGVKMPTVYTDNVSGSYEATTHLIKEGHRRIGVIVGRRTLDSMIKRVEGYRKALKAYRIKFDPSLVIDARDVGVEGGYGAAKELLDRRPRPTALLVMNNLLTLGTLNAIKERGLAIPQDIALVGWDDFPAAPHLATPLSVIEQSAYSMGSLAAEQLMKMLSNQPCDPSPQIVLRTELIIRESSKGPPA
jgi:DNA-binding LacI/PurR family transcriptional regulator